MKILKKQSNGILTIRTGEASTDNIFDNEVAPGLRQFAFSVKMNDDGLRALEKLREFARIATLFDEVSKCLFGH